jgi:hypothetical protein
MMVQVVWVVLAQVMPIDGTLQKNLRICGDVPLPTPCILCESMHVRQFTGLISDSATIQSANALSGKFCFLRSQHFRQTVTATANSPVLTGCDATIDKRRARLVALPYFRALVLLPAADFFSSSCLFLAFLP